MSQAHIHPSAVIHPDALLGPDVQVGPLVVVEHDVVVGAGTRLLTGTLLQAGSRVGDNCVLGPYAVLGSLPMDAGFKGEPSLVEIGNEVEIRDFATVHRATGEGLSTRVGSGSMLMSYVHVSHNVQVGQEVVLTAGCQLGGHSSVGDRAVLGAGAMLHQFVRVGELAMVGAMGGLNRDGLPFTLLHGMYAEHYGLNRVGLKRRGFEGERYRHLEQAYRALRRKDRELLDQLAQVSKDVRRLQEFIASSNRGLSTVRTNR